jgi:hypothetical protein
MKKTFLYTGLIVLAGALLASCYKDIITPDLPEDPNAPPQQVSFKNELAPIFNANCTDVGCHVSGGHHPYMTSDASYQEIVNGGFVNTAFPKQSILYQEIYGEMGVHIPSLSDRQKVYDWIRNGAPNN